MVTLNSDNDSNTMATALITGSSKGIGLATALAFARKGHQVAAGVRNPERAIELMTQAKHEHLPITVYTLDVDSDGSVQEAVASISKDLGPIDVLVNNAGVERMGAVEELPLVEFRAVMETNYFGAIRCTQSVLLSMRERRSGCIINVSSVAGRVASPAMSAYSASKFALESLSEILAQEVKAFGIHVGIVEPGIIDTPMAKHITIANRATHYPHQNRLAALFTDSLKRPVSPSLVANKILDIYESGTWQLRHLVGPDAQPLLSWRQSMSDEAWVDHATLADKEWYTRAKIDIGR